MAMSSETKAKGIAVHPSLIGGGADAAGLKDFLKARTAAGDRLYIMAPLSQADGEAAMNHLNEVGAFDALDAGGYGFTLRDTFFPRAEAVLARQMRAADISVYVGRNDGFAAYSGFPKGAYALILGTASGKVPPFETWADLNAFLNADVLKGFQLDHIVPLRRRNASIYRLVARDGAPGLILNAHWQPNDAAAERAMLDAVRAAGVPALQQVWASGNVSVYKDPGGTKCVSVSSADLDLLGNFIVSLDGRAAKLSGLRDAPDARFTLDSYLEAVNSLWKEVYAQAQKHNKDIMFFMMTDLEQLRQDNINHFYLWCKREKWEKSDVLPNSERLFKPGQLGFHNTLIAGDQVTVLDSADAGWDDPARVIADFILNNEQTLATRDKLRVLEAFTRHIKDETKFLKRFWAVADLLAVEWILKLLSVVLPAQRTRLLATLTEAEYNALVKDRLAFAQHLRDSFETMEHVCKHDQLLDEGAEIR